MTAVKPPSLGEQLGHRRAVGVVVLDPERAAGAQQRRRPGDDRPDHRQTVRAAEDRLGRVVPGHLRRDHHVVRHVRRVAEQHVHPAHQVGQQVRRGHVGLDHLDRPVPRRGPLRRVAPQPGQRRRGPLHRDHPRPRQLLGHRQRDRARAAAQVDHHRVGPALGLLDAPAGQQLGLRPGHEDARADRQLQVPEPGATGQVLQRLARGAATRQLVEPRQLVVAEVVGERQPTPGHPEHVRGQQLGLHPGRADPGGGEHTGRSGHRGGRPDGACPFGGVLRQSTHDIIMKRRGRRDEQVRPGAHGRRLAGGLARPGR